MLQLCDIGAHALNRFTQLSVLQRKFLVHVLQLRGSSYWKEIEKMEGMRLSQASLFDVARRSESVAK